MVNMLWIGKAININIDIGCWNQSGPLAEVKALKTASSYATFFLGNWYGPVYISFPPENRYCLQQRLQEIKAADGGDDRLHTLPLLEEMRISCCRLKSVSLPLLSRYTALPSAGRLPQGPRTAVAPGQREELFCIRGMRRREGLEDGK